jgi:hypothetical protein
VFRYSEYDRNPLPPVGERGVVVGVGLGAEGVWEAVGVRLFTGVGVKVAVGVVVCVAVWLGVAVGVAVSVADGVAVGVANTRYSIKR